MGLSVGESVHMNLRAMHSLHCLLLHVLSSDKQQLRNGAKLVGCQALGAKFCPTHYPNRIVSNTESTPRLPGSRVDYFARGLLLQNQNRSNNDDDNDDEDNNNNSEATSRTRYQNRIKKKIDR